ncbi:hypothetical protein ABDJ41_01150 [Pedobacter sp. ASV1-7]|uniref:hypothetical protein n=1 Tax=Pedobacter sp. ASV1-7 TaxID=3145237 RepID=UPI0032E8E899
MKSNFLYLFSFLLSASILSCKQNSTRNTAFIQPSILTKGSSFDFAKITFNENTEKLVSKLLDTTESGFTGNNYEVFLYDKNADFSGPVRDQHHFKFPEKRYVLKTKIADSIAQFDSIYFNQVILETDAQKKLTAIIGKTKFEHKNGLDSLLNKLFKKYGKTFEMQKYDQHNAKVEAEFTKDMTPEQKEMSRQGTPVMDYATYLLDYGKEGSVVWMLKDRIIQVSFDTDREISISSTGEYKNIEYLYVDFLVLTKDEYQKTGEAQLENAKITKAGLQPFKVYNLYDFDPINPERLELLEKAWDK